MSSSPKKFNVVRYDHKSIPRRKEAFASFPQIWAIGDFAILEKRLVGFFCSVKCPGNVILRIYDLVRGLRDAGVTVIGGFHSPMEKECLELLLRGEQPIVICPSRSIERMRLPNSWRGPLTEGRLLVLSPFEARERRPTLELAERRNCLVASLSDVVLVAHAAAGSSTEGLLAELEEQGKPAYTLNLFLKGQSEDEEIATDQVISILS